MTQLSWIFMSKNVEDYVKRLRNALEVKGFSASGEVSNLKFHLKEGDIIVQGSFKVDDLWTLEISVGREAEKNLIVTPEIVEAHDLYPSVEEMRKLIGAGYEADLKQAYLEYVRKLAEAERERWLEECDIEIQVVKAGVEFKVERGLVTIPCNVGRPHTHEYKGYSMRTRGSEKDLRRIKPEKLAEIIYSVAKCSTCIL